MSNFQTRFDSASSEARRLFVEHGSEIRDLIPGLYGTDFERLTRSISRLLEKVDKGSVDHPEYLAHSTGNIAEYAVQVIDSVPSSIASGAAHFTQTTIPTLLLCEEKLVSAVGHYHYQVKEVKDRQVKEIQKLAEEAIEFRESAREASEEIEKVQTAATEAFKSIGTLQSEAQKAANKVGEVRDLVTKLASGDARGKSLEGLKRQAEAKLDAIDDVLVKANTAKSSVSKLDEELRNWNESFSAADKGLQETKKQADLVLGLSSQAGLASSYLKESKKLAMKSYIYSGILYATSIAAAVIAALYVLPDLQDSLETTAGTSAGKAIPLAFLRATILAPLVYIIYFTSRQISAIETIRMDYAEKAAASLAYSGYKGEMSEDGSLLERLRGSLLLKFAEHPERLLRKHPGTDRIEVEAPGFKASSTSADAPSPSKKAEEGAEEE